MFTTLPGPAARWAVHPADEDVLRKDLPDLVLADDAYNLMFGPKKEARKRYGRVRDLDWESLVIVPHNKQKTDIMGNIIDEDMIQDKESMQSIVLGEVVDGVDVEGDDCEVDVADDDDEDDSTVTIIGSEVDDPSDDEGKDEE